MARLDNLDKLYLVPVLALRKMLEQKYASDETKLAEMPNLRQEELVTEADRQSAVTEDDINRLYELYRYGRRLSLQIFLLPDDFASNADDNVVEQTIAELIQDSDITDESATLGENDDDDFSWDEVGGRVTICDHVRFNDVLEIRFKYLILHRYLNRSEESAHVFETRYGYLWLCPAQRYLAVLAKDNAVAKKMLDSVAIALHVMPKPVQFPKDLIDRHFEKENVKRMTHLDPETGVRQSISGDREALTGYIMEIENRDRRYVRPGALYEEEIDETLSSGLGLTAKRGRVYFTRTLSTTQVHHWVDTRLRDFIADLHIALNEEPAKVYEAATAVKRIRGLDDIQKMNLELILDAVTHAKREGVQSVSLGDDVNRIHSVLGDAWLQRQYVFSCPECDEACGFCPQCRSANIVVAGQELSCAECGSRLSNGGMAILCCVNDHKQRFDITESLVYFSTSRLQREIIKRMNLLDLSWDARRDTVYVDSGGLHHLSAPPDMTTNQFGDLIVANVGSNVSGVNIGKDIHISGGGGNGNQTG